jgi:hypothetical protein
VEKLAPFLPLPWPHPVKALLGTHVLCSFEASKMDNLPPTRKRRRPPGWRPLPPMIGAVPLPKEQRPKCLSCRAQLKPNIFMHAHIVGGTRWREWDGTYGDGQGFCGELCAATFGRMIRRMLSQLPTRCGACGFPVTSPWPIEDEKETPRE